ncbi:hypothetical protein FSST1_006480 [Fusarium sambucinum]
MRYIPMVASLFAGLVSSTSLSIDQRDTVGCMVDDKTGAVFVTADCVDPDYAFPVIDSETDETSPVPYRKVSGHFNGTTLDFTIYLTPKSKWDGRFFQLMYPSQTSAADDNTILFGVESGGYTVQASASTGYRADAAAAKFSRQVASKYYNVSSEQIYGYVYGGSGGSLKAIGAAEKTSGVWNGCVALIQATPMSIPYNWGIRAFGGFILKNHSDKLIDAIQPGGSGHPNVVLNELERAIFKETEQLGIPPRGWEDWDSIVRNRTQQLQTLKDIAIPMVQSMDPTYADDFWTQDGYAGRDQSELGERFRAALFQFNSSIEKTTKGKDELTSDFVLANLPDSAADVDGLGFSVIVGNASQHFSGKLDVGKRTVYILGGASNTTLEALVQGANITIDNRWYLAMHTFHRHQLPPQESGFYGHNYLRNEEGQPLFPQRQTLVGPLISQSSAGGATHTGNITMKLIVMNNLLDFDAFSWHADWYKTQVEKAKGGLKDHYRLYYSDNADHIMGYGNIKSPYTNRVVDFTGLYQQHLRDLSAWVENDVNPPKPTNYTVVNGQIEIPSNVSERLGIQPVVELLVDGTKRAQVAQGEDKVFTVKAQVPDGIGKIVTVEWDPLGLGEFTKKDIEVGSQVDVQFSYSYEKPGVYFASVRAASHRNGNTDTEVGLAWNLDRVRVIVE